MLSSKIKSLQKQLSEHPASESSHEPLANYSVGELEKVVNSMKKVIEKLQMENDTLKRSQAASRPTQTKTEGGKRATALQEENNRLKVTEILAKQH